MYDKSIEDITLSFKNDEIDDKRLYGKQYLSLEIRTKDRRGQLIEIRNIDNIVVCPGEDSPRFAFYDSKDCMKGDISLNTYLSRKTTQLEDWSSVEIKIKHQSDKHGGDGFSQRIEIILERRYDFDISVSFPGGLIVKKPSEPGYGTISGVSLAAIAQFSFYKPGKIAELRPYNFGVGTLALNSFSFTNSDDQDLGIVALGSVSPTKRDTKLKFTLYAGGGYFIKETKWFVLLGPGIRVKL